jgi:hypothetical protein
MATISFMIGFLNLVALFLCQSSVDRQINSRGVFGLIGSEINCGVGNLIGDTNPSGGNLPHNGKEAGRFSGDPAATSQFYNAVVQGMDVLHRSGRDYSVLENVASNAMNAWPE